MTLSSPSIKRKLLSGTSWIFAGYGLSMFLRFGSSIVLTRLLFPEIYGVMSIVWSFLYAVAMLSDVGAGSAVIQSSKGDDVDFLNTAWCLQIIRGIFICLVCGIAGWPMSLLYDKPELALVIPVLGVTSIFQGFQSTKVLTLQRRVNLKRLTMLDLLVQLITILLTIGCAYYWKSVWALVPGPLMGELVRAFVSHRLLADYNNKLQFNRQNFRDIFGFGRWVFISSAFYFFSRQSDRFLLGYFAGLSFLGIYSVAAQIIDAIENLVTKLNHSVLYPTLSKIKEDRVRFKEVFYKIRFFYELVGFPLLGLLVILSPMIISVLYDDRYHDAGWIMQFLLCKVALYAMFTSCETCLVALGQPRYSSMRNGCKMLWVTVGIPIAWTYADLPEVLLVLVTAELPSVLFFWPAMARMGVLRIGRELFPVVMFIFGASVGYLGNKIILQGLPISLEILKNFLKVTDTLI